MHKQTHTHEQTETNNGDHNVDIGEGSVAEGVECGYLFEWVDYSALQTSVIQEVQQYMKQKGWANVNDFLAENESDINTLFPVLNWQYDDDRGWTNS